MTSTVLDVTVLLLCVSASVVALGGVGGDAGTRGPTAEGAADRIVTETVTVRYRSPRAANGTRTVHATRAELLALLVAASGSAGDERGAVDGEGAFEPRATAAIAAGLGERTRVDATVTAVPSREPSSTQRAVDRRPPAPRGCRPATGRIAASGTPNAPRSPQRTAGQSREGPDRTDGGSRGTERPRPGRDGNARAVVVGAEPPRNADVTTAVVTQPTPDAAETDDPVQIVVRRW
ncbi:hypothetical protein [Halorubrum sp. Ea8]|uniref:DUF7284 family protein n=1 Tax=Halorubrum sp. Ea8 TaxID=1383841 RepID=UPI000B991C16|nr:hypothetical protein [Halorubrum sp. Ea8]OYR46892.1 hypothetical protein DJ74_14015 [Halorubrum sp. Ea8]